MLDHVTLGVSDIERSIRFYDQALRPLGIERLYAEGENAAGYGAGRKAFFWISLRGASQTAATSLSQPKTGKSSIDFTRPRSQPAAVTTGSRGCARTITKITTGRSCLILTATTLKRFVTGSVIRWTMR
jgi:hypothetical protein